MRTAQRADCGPRRVRAGSKKGKTDGLAPELQPLHRAFSEEAAFASAAFASVYRFRCRQTRRGHASWGHPYCHHGVSFRMTLLGSCSLRVAGAGRFLPFAGHAAT